jgi:hypothetical protein
MGYLLKTTLGDLRLRRKEGGVSKFLKLSKTFERCGLNGLLPYHSIENGNLFVITAGSSGLNVLKEQKSSIASPRMVESHRFSKENFFVALGVRERVKSESLKGSALNVTKLGLTVDLETVVEKMSSKVQITDWVRRGIEDYDFESEGIELKEIGKTGLARETRTIGCLFKSSLGYVMISGTELRQSSLVRDFVGIGLVKVVTEMYRKHLMILGFKR